MLRVYSGPREHIVFELRYLNPSGADITIDFPITKELFHYQRKSVVTLQALDLIYHRLNREVERQCG